jgi:hypothetical protein
MQQLEGYLLSTETHLAGVSHDTLIWHSPLNNDLQKRSLASRSDCANWEQGVAGSNLAVPTTSTNPLVNRDADGPSLG